MSETDELHLRAAKYADRRKEAYLDYLKKGLAEKLSKKMVDWIWVAHYEGYRDAFHEKIIDIEQIRVRIMSEAYDLADRDDHEGYNAIKVMCSEVLKLASSAGKVEIEGYCSEVDKESK
jgi:hypothetical protein